VEAAENLLNGKLHNLCLSPNTLGVIKSGMVRWGGTWHEMPTGFWLDSLKVRDH